MRLLLILPSIPHPGNRLAGAPNARSTEVLTEICETVRAVATRPWTPWFLRFHPKWRTYFEIPARCSWDTIVVDRPAVFTVPVLGGMRVTELTRTEVVKRFLARHYPKDEYDAVLSFDLLGCGGVAWRLGRHYGIPAAGWAVGSDVRVRRSSARGRLLAQTIRHLDLVFYQSEELRQIGRGLVGDAGAVEGKHRVRSRGITLSADRPRPDVRREVRQELGIGEDEVMVLYVGRIVRDKGVFGLVEALGGRRSTWRPRLVILGAVPAYDETEQFMAFVRERGISDRDVSVLPACAPEAVARYYGASDVYVFPSLKEGMPNSVLEAMSAGLPVVAFDIPAIQSINDTERVISTVPTEDFPGMVRELEALARDEGERRAVGERARDLVARRFDMRNTMRAVVEDLGRVRQSGTGDAG